MKSYPFSTVVGVGNPAPLDAAIVPTSINSGNLASLVAGIMDASDDPLCIFVDFTQRKVVAKVAVEDIATAAVAALAAADGAILADDAGLLASVVLTKTDLTKRTSLFTADGLAEFAIGGGTNKAFHKSIIPEHPVIATSAIVGGVEDMILDAASPLFGAPVIACVDQGSGKVTLVAFDTSDHSAGALNATAFTIAYKQNITSSGGGTVRTKLE